MTAVVGCLGAGAVGASWAALFLARGWAVRLYDPAIGSAQAGGPAADPRGFIAAAWPAMAALGVATEAAETAAERLSIAGSAAEAVGGAAFVQESAPERLDAKHALYAAIEPALAPGCVVASSTSGLRLSALQRGFADPSPLIIGHPFNPPHLIPLVELYANEATAPEALTTAEGVYAGLGKETVRLHAEVPGHIANRLQAALWREAIHLIRSGVASLEDVDRAVTAGPGLRWAAMGPSMLFHLGGGGRGIGHFCDHIGPAMQTWWDDLGDAAFDAPTVAALEAGVADAARERDHDALCAERDARLIALLKARSGA